VAVRCRFPFLNYALARSAERIMKRCATGETVMTYTLGTASKATGVSKSTIYRAIKSGRLSATRSDAASDYAIEPAELHRVFPPVSRPPETVDETAPARSMTQDATPPAQADTARVELEKKNAALEQEIRGLRELLEEVRTSRDQIASTLRSVVAALPPPMPGPATPARRRGWFGWKRAG
jgi:excisionase family DNA binding protein